MATVSERDSFLPRDVAPGLRRYEGSFAPNGSSAVAAASNRGAGGVGRWSVARVSTGLFRITTVDRFAAVDSATFTIALATGGVRHARLGPVSVTNKTIDVEIVDGVGAVADIAADAGNRINFNLVLRGSSVTV
jgi:hypothetical protein